MLQNLVLVIIGCIFEFVVARFRKRLHFHVIDFLIFMHRYKLTFCQARLDEFV